MFETCSRVAWRSIFLAALCFLIAIYFDVQESFPNGDNLPALLHCALRGVAFIGVGALAVSLFSSLFALVIAFRQNIFYWKKCLTTLCFALNCAIWVFLLLPSVSTMGDGGRRLENANNIRQITVAVENYGECNKQFPPRGENGHSWRVYLLPYLGEQDLYNQIRLDEPWNSDWNKQFHNQMPRVYANPLCRQIFREAKNETVCLSDGTREKRRLSLTTYVLCVKGKYLDSSDGGESPAAMGAPADNSEPSFSITESAPERWMNPNKDMLLLDD